MSLDLGYRLQWELELHMFLGCGNCVRYLVKTCIMLLLSIFMTILDEERESAIEKENSRGISLEWPCLLNGTQFTMVVWQLKNEPLGKFLEDQPG